MLMQQRYLASAVVSALAVWSAAAVAQEKALSEVIVTATPFNASEGEQILAPAEVLTGHDLRTKLAPTLGETLSRELGVSTSAFGAGASRPVLRNRE